MNGKAWTERDTDTLRRMVGKYTDEEIALATGHPPRTVRRRRTDLGFDACCRIDWSKRKLESIDD